MNLRVPASLLLVTLGFFTSSAPAALDEEAAPIEATELRTVQALYAAAQQKEADALAAFREIRAMQASRSLQITLEEARARLRIPAPDRPPIDLSILKLVRPDPARVVEQRRTLLAVSERIDEILTFVRQLKEQLEQDETSAEAVTLDGLRHELARREIAADLAAEDEGQPSKDLTDTAPASEASPSDAASVDAMIAHRAAGEARAMADQAAATNHHAATAADALATQARTAADQATAAARATASEPDRAKAADHAAEALAKSREAINAAIQVAQLTGNLSFVAAQTTHAETAADTRKTAVASSDSQPDAAKPAVNAKDLGGFHPGATKFIPGEARPSRRIGGQGSGVRWIFIDSWYILGPFPNPDRRNVDTSFPPESVIDLDATYQGAQGEGLRWRFLQSQSPYVVPEDPKEYVIYYAYSEIWCDQAMDLWVMVGSDDSSRIWLNDQQIWKSVYKLKPWRLDEGLRKVSFRRGINRILYRFENGWGLTGFSFAINLAPASSGNLSSKRARGVE